MYTLFVQKQRGDESPFSLTEQLHEFILKTKANGIFVSPGYLSKGEDKIKIFLDTLLEKSNISRFGIGNSYGRKYKGRL